MMKLVYGVRVLRRRPATSLLVVWATLLCGCGGSGRLSVSGVVTLDNRPLAGAVVSFMPKAKTGEAVVVRTDENGQYELQDSTSTPGALPGKYKVFISTYQEGNTDIEPPIPTVPERVPAEYKRRGLLDLRAVIR